MVSPLFFKGSRKPRLPLAAQREHKNRVNFLNISVERDITASATPDHQFSLIFRNGPSDKRVFFENVQRLDDFTNAREHIVNLKLRQMLKDTVEVVPDLGRQFDS